MKSLNRELKISTIQGISSKYFDDFKDLELEIIFYEDAGIKNEFLEKVIEYIIISTLVFPYDFVRDIILDESKVLLKRTQVKILELWKKLKDTKPVIIKSSKQPENKEPKLRIVFPISKDENSFIELDNSVSEETIERTIEQYFELLHKQFNNRTKEQKYIAKSRLNIGTKKNKKV